MNAEMLRAALVHYSSLSFDPEKTCYVHTNREGHQTPLPWHEVASAAVYRLDDMKQLVVAASAKPMGKFWLHIQRERAALLQEINDLRARNQWQAEVIITLEEARE